MNEKNIKSTNPFQMLGSYLGAIIIPITYGFIVDVLIDKSSFENYFQGLIRVITFERSFLGYLPSIIFYSLIFLGFLIGWYIHHLINKSK